MITIEQEDNVIWQNNNQLLNGHIC